MNRFDLQHYFVNRSINQTCNGKSKIGLPSVNITLHYAMWTSTLVDFTGRHREEDAEKDSCTYKVSLEGLDSCTLLWDNSLFTSVVAQKPVNCVCRVWSWIMMTQIYHRHMNKYTQPYTPALTTGVNMKRQSDTLDTNMQTGGTAL